MKDKTKKPIKYIIIAVSLIAGLIAWQALYQVIGMVSVSASSNRSEIRYNIERYINKYNKTCKKDRKLRIDHYYEGGSLVHCDLEYSEEKKRSKDEVISFLIEFHNSFGYDSFCDAETNSEFFRKYDEIYFNLEGVRMYYGDEIPLPVELSDERENIDAAVHVYTEKYEIDTETISKFKGAVFTY